jgi:hypothetical protein
MPGGEKSGKQQKGRGDHPPAVYRHKTPAGQGNKGQGGKAHDRGRLPPAYAKRKSRKNRDITGTEPEPPKLIRRIPAHEDQAQVYRDDRPVPGEKGEEPVADYKKDQGNKQYGKKGIPRRGKKMGAYPKQGGGILPVLSFPYRSFI